MEEREHTTELTEEELERQTGEPLPDRTQMSLLRADPTPIVGGDAILPAPGPGPIDS